MERKYYNEKWLDLDLGDFDNGVYYQLSNYGRIKSFAYDKKSGRVLKGGLVQGYRTMSFSAYQGARITKYLHKLVANQFVDRPNEDHKFVIHLDFNKTNNYFENLKWVTKKEKEEHQNINPNFVATKSTVKYSKLSLSQVILIKKALKVDRNKLKTLADRFGITHTQVNRIKKGENWASVRVD